MLTKGAAQELMPLPRGNNSDIDPNWINYLPPATALLPKPTNYEEIKELPSTSHAATASPKEEPVTTATVENNSHETPPLKTPPPNDDNRSSAAQTEQKINPVLNQQWRLSSTIPQKADKENSQPASRSENTANAEKTARPNNLAQAENKSKVSKTKKRLINRGMRRTTYANTWEIQFIAQRDVAEIKSYKEELLSQYTELLKDYELAIVMNETKKFYRLRLRYINDETSARDLCAKFKENKVDCFVARTESTN